MIAPRRFPLDDPEPSPWLALRVTEWADLDEAATALGWPPSEVRRAARQGLLVAALLDRLRRKARARWAWAFWLVIGLGFGAALGMLLAR